LIEKIYDTDETGREKEEEGKKFKQRAANWKKK
jgi:hypothetical protein